MPDVRLRKLIFCQEEIFHEGGPKPALSQRRAAALAVIENPFAGRYVDEIQPFMEPLKPLGLTMAERLVTLLGGADQIEGYGRFFMFGVSYDF